MKQSFANIFGALGYLSLVIQWLWMGLVIGAPFVASDFFKNLLLPETDPTPTDSISMNVPEPIGIIFMVLAVIFALGVTIYAIVAVPSSIARTGQKATLKTAQVIVPRITHHKHVSKKREKTLIERITWSVKLLLTLVPVIALSVPPDDIVGLSHSVVVGVGLFCGAATVVWFSLEFAIAKLGKIEPRNVW